MATKLESLKTIEGIIKYSLDNLDNSTRMLIHFCGNDYRSPNIGLDVSFLTYDEHYFDYVKKDKSDFSSIELTIYNSIYMLDLSLTNKDVFTIPLYNNQNFNSISIHNKILKIK